MNDSTSGGPADPNDPFAQKPYVPPTWATDDPRPADDPAVQDQPERRDDQPEHSDNQPERRDPAADETPTEQITHRYQPVDDATAPTETVPTETVPTTSGPISADYPRPTGESAATNPNATQALPPYASFESEQAPVAERPKKKRRGRKLLVAFAIVLLGIAGGIGGAAGYEAIRDNGNSGVISSLDNKSATDTTPAGAIEKVAQSVLPSVVQINVKGDGAKGSGTGIIISNDGQILTNNHVVEAAADGGTITVSFNDNSIESATILGRDPLTDLAVIKANKTGLTPAKLGDSASLRVGQEVVAIGSPFGLESTVTSGIVSALNRPVSSSDGSNEGPRTVFPAIQTDAAINPGNSGGPLVDLNGQVVGINSAIRSNQSASGQGGSIGLGFAIPIDLAKTVSKSLVKGEKVSHSEIGITIGPAVTSDGITAVGAEVRGVTKGSAGDKAGLKKGDIVTALNGRPITGVDALLAAIRGYSPGQSVKLTVKRGDSTNTVKVTLDSDGGNLSP